MIDIHSHLLPGIDDGSQSVRQSVEVLQMFADHGVSGVVLTPHVTASEMANDHEAPIAKRDAAFELLGNVGITAPELHLGFEIMLDQPMSSSSVRDRRFSLAGSRYYLVEFPYSVVPHFAGHVLAMIVEQGGIPVVAHPERYNGCAPHVVAGWRDQGAKMQIDSTTLTQPTYRGHRARELLGAGLADVIAADNHGNPRVLSTGVEYLGAKGAAIQAHLLAVENPAAIVDDREMVSVPQVELKEGLLSRWKRFVSG